jgi:hypothetical protein
MDMRRFLCVLSAIAILISARTADIAAQGGSDTPEPFFFPATNDNDDNRNFSQVAKRTEFYKALLAKPDGVDAVVEHLLQDQIQDEVYTRLMGLSYFFEKEKKIDLVAPIFDKLRAKKTLYADILAADLLLKTVAATLAEGGSWASLKPIMEFPDGLCDRAAALLDHPDPVVQAVAEWALTLRFKKQNAKTSSVSELFSAENRRKAWFQKWSSRAVERALDDDYGRQITLLDRHRTLAGLTAELDRVEARMDALMKSPEGRLDKVAETRGGYDEALQSVRAAIARGDLLAAHQAYPAMRHAARAIIAAAREEFPVEGVAFMTNSRIPGGDWNVNMPVTNGTNMPGGDIYFKKGANPSDEIVPLGLQKELGDGSVRGMDLFWDASKIVFSYWHQPIDPNQRSGWDSNKSAHLYEMDLSSRKISQLTKKHGNNDIEPAYLPNGDVVFASDRTNYGNQCAGPFTQHKRCTALFRLDPKRSVDPVSISNNKDFDRFPHVLNDGTVVFMRWEYQERDLYNSHTAWRCRPDGVNMDAFYKQHIAYPMSIRDVRQAPDSDICAATVQGHHDSHIGPVILFNPSLGINNTAAMWLVTPGVMAVEGGLGPLYGQVVPEGGVENRGGSYINPFPMSDKALLVGHDMEGVGGYKRSGGKLDYGLYYIDVWGNRELIHREKETSCFIPHPLRTRRLPPIIPDTVNPDATYATVYVENVYRDMPGVKQGAVKYLRISQRLMLPAPVDYDDPNYDFNHHSWQPGDSTAVHFGYWTFAPTRTVGLVDVEADGSAYFNAPAGAPIFFQALDENFCEVRRMRTSFTLQRGELRGCLGCHESRHEAVGSLSPDLKKTLSKGPQTPVPPPWGDREVQDYRKHVQPVFDKHCVGCHGEKEPKGKLDLSGRPVAGFTQSYRSLFGLKPGDPQPINALDLHLDLHPEAKDFKYIGGRDAQKLIKNMQRNAYPGQLVNISDKNSRDADVTQPYQFGTNNSKLIRVLLDEENHKKIRANMTKDEWLSLVTWIDHNANFHSTVMDKTKYGGAAKTVARVPVYLPDPWIPADISPTFYNNKDSAIVPKEFK